MYRSEPVQQVHGQGVHDLQGLLHPDLPQHQVHNSNTLFFLTLLRVAKSTPKWDKTKFS